MHFWSDTGFLPDISCAYIRDFWGEGGEGKGKKEIVKVFREGGNEGDEGKKRNFIY